CDRCGSVTLECCRTCGEELTGSVALPGMVPIGARQPPHYCPSCGAPFPWADRRRSLAPSFRAQLENLLRRLPLVLRQLRTRSGERPPIAVQDERDLEDVVRALLPLYFDDIRPTARTPRYASFTRTDFLLAPQHIAVTVKLVPSQVKDLTLAEQIREDAAYW